MENNQKLFIFLIIFAFVFICLMEITNYIKLCRIEKKYTKSVKVIRHRMEVEKTIKYFEEKGWLVGTITTIPTSKDYIEITFIK